MIISIILFTSINQIADRLTELLHRPKIPDVPQVTEAIVLNPIVMHRHVIQHSTHQYITFNRTKLIMNLKRKNAKTTMIMTAIVIIVHRKNAVDQVLALGTLLTTIAVELRSIVDDHHPYHHHRHVRVKTIIIYLQMEMENPYRGN